MSEDSISKNSQPPRVIWMNNTRSGLPPELVALVERDLQSAFMSDAAEVVLVKQRFTGFVKDVERKLILAVEVQGPGGTHASVVKIGPQSAVGGDYQGWQTCAVQRGVVSRLMIAPVLRRGTEERVVVIYPDVYQYYLNEKRSEEQPQDLETVVNLSIIFGVPTATSVERVLTQIYTEADRCFYRDAIEDMTAEHVRHRLAEALLTKDGRPVQDCWQVDAFQSLRQTVAWLTCGHRQPDSLVRPEYIDPVDYLDWVVRQHRYPPMLVGPSHGDLHGRNAIVGVVRREAEWPALIDFDKLTPTNLVAWDFAKLEFELKCRLYSQMLDTPEEQAEVRRLLQLPNVRPLPESVLNSLEQAEHGLLRQIECLELMIGIERRLQTWTRQIDSAGAAEKIDMVFTPEIPANTPLGRAMRILFRIRREAALVLGFWREERKGDWRNEYQFALAAYGVMSVKWHQPTEFLFMAWTLITAGIAAAELSQLPWPPATAEIPVLEEAATYLSLLPAVHAKWKSGKAVESIAALRTAIARYPYAVALKQELALQLAHTPAGLQEISQVLRELSKQACLFRDYETLCRLGAIEKTEGDRQYRPGTTFAEALNRALPVYQAYVTSLKYYELAYELTGHYYPAINAATLSMLTGASARQQQLAQSVLDICRLLPIDKGDRIWILASEGEAALLLGRTQQAVEFYRSVLDAMTPRESGVLQSIYNQLCRLLWSLGPEIVQPVIDLVKQSPLAQSLKPGPFHDCGQTAAGSQV